MKAVAVFLIAAAMAAADANAAPQRPLIVTTQDHSLVTIDDCEHFYATTRTSFPVQAQAEEQFVVPLAGIETLRVRGSEGGGVSIRGWDRPMARLTVCKYAVAFNDADAKQTLSEVSVLRHHGEIGAIGPAAADSRAWWVHMIVRVPKHAAVDVASTSGGIAIRNMGGHVTARATNGGISLASCTGESRLSTENGGISLEKIGGRLDASTQNGSISLKMQGSDSSAIEARTDDTNDIVCRAKICATATSTRSAAGRVLRIGAAQPTIRLSAGSAPILIEQVR